MRFGDNSFNYFPENKLTKFTILVQFKRVLVLFGELRGPAPPPCLRHCTTVCVYPAIIMALSPR